MSQEPPAEFRPAYEEPRRPGLLGVAREALRDGLLPIALLTLFLIGTAGLGGRLLAPWLRHWALLDDVVELARRPVADGDLRVRLAEAARTRGLGEELRGADFAIVTDREMRWRRIRVRYQTVDRPLPGWSRRLSWRLDVREPVLFRAPTRHY